MMNAKIWMEHFQSQADGNLPPSSYQPPTDDQPGFVYLNRHVKKKHLPPSTGSVQVVSPVQQAVQQAKNEIMREEKEDVMEEKEKKKRKTHKRKQSKTVSAVRRKQRKEDVFDRA